MGADGSSIFNNVAGASGAPPTTSTLTPVSGTSVTGGGTAAPPTTASTIGANTSSLAASPLPNQQVAPLTPQQLQAMNLTSALTPGTQGAADTALAENANIAGGSLLSPSGMNPQLQQYYNAIAAPMVQNYQTATMPNILATEAETGTLGSPGASQAMTAAQNTLGQNLSNLGAEIAEPAYATNVNATLSAGAQNPSLVSGAYTPASQLAASGATSQNQAQNVLNAGYNNAYSQATWPYQELGMLGSAFGNLGGGGTTISTGTLGGGGSMK
jgi:hypothetical protein